MNVEVLVLAVGMTLMVLAGVLVFVAVVTEELWGWRIPLSVGVVLTLLLSGVGLIVVTALVELWREALG